MHRRLIVAKIQPDAERRGARIFPEEHRTDLPPAAGVRHRSLFGLGELDVHLPGTDDVAAVDKARRHPDFAKANGLPAGVIVSHLPAWRSSTDAPAQCLYGWGPTGVPAGAEEQR